MMLLLVLLGGTFLRRWLAPAHALWPLESW